ncbi:MAG TPA: transcription termination factor Rho, partial [Clostridium sp.]|nr:transcription termination factor Rho [Clostridium sp.]
MNVIELKGIAKELGIKNIAKFKKSELIEEIKRVSSKSNEIKNGEDSHKANEKVQPAQIEKEGVILKEKLTKREVAEGVNIYENNRPLTKEDNGYTKKIYNESANKDLDSEELNETKEIVMEEKIDSIEEKRERLKSLISESETAKGVFELSDNANFGLLRMNNYLSSNDDIYVSISQVRRFNLKT